MKLSSLSLFLVSGLASIPTNDGAHSLLRNPNNKLKGHVIPENNHHHEEESESHEFWERILTDGGMSMIMMDAGGLDNAAPDREVFVDSDTMDGGGSSGGNVAPPPPLPLETTPDVGAFEQLPPCALEIQDCSDGTTVMKGAPDCEWEDCPPGSCLLDTQDCDDGSVVLRDPNNNCEFQACPPPGQTTCPELGCPEGTYCALWNDSCNDCFCNSQDGISFCTLKLCEKCTESITACVPTCDVNGCLPLAVGPPVQEVPCPDTVPSGPCSVEQICKYNKITCCDGYEAYADIASCVNDEWMVLSRYIECSDECEPPCPESVPSGSCTGDQTCNYNMITCCGEEQGYADYASCVDDEWLVMSALIVCPDECDTPVCPESLPDASSPCTGDDTNCNYNMITCCGEEQDYADVAFCEDDQWVVISAYIQCPDECDPPICPESVPSGSCEGDKTCNYNMITCCGEEQGYADVASCVGDEWRVMSSYIRCPDECE